jgi:serine/threonine protein kinase
VCAPTAHRSRLHSLGILHRDVKLENLLCDTSTRPPKVKLCDFGHAVLQHDLAHDRQFYGTPGYAAPEVTQGPVWSAKADVWAMGVVMYALLANSLPFECDDGWRRPADLSSRVWWRVSLEAKLLLQVERETALSNTPTCRRGATAVVAAAKAAATAAATAADDARVWLRARSAMAGLGSRERREAVRGHAT